MKCKRLLFACLLCLTAIPCFSDTLVYKWRLSGRQVLSTSGSMTDAAYNSVKEKGYMVVSYDPTTEEYSSEKLLKYWKNQEGKFYVIENFLYGLAEFIPAENPKKQFLTISGFYGGVNGDEYNGMVRLMKAKQLGGNTNAFIAPQLRGSSSWDKMYEDDSNAIGNAKVTLTLDGKLTKTANQRSLTVDQTIDYIITDKLSSYQESTTKQVVLNAPIFQDVNIRSGNINGTTIGDATPAAGTFTSLQTGVDGTDGELTIYSEQGDTDYKLTLKPNAAMTQDVTLTFPVDDGDANQILSTDGSGNLSWISSSSIDGETNVGENVGTSGSDVYAGKSGVALQFRKINAASNKVSVATNGNEIQIDVNSDNILTNGGVTSAKLEDGSVTTAKLADSAVTSAKIADFTIATSDIADSAISTAKVADSAISTAKVADSAITTAKISDGTITDSDLADGSITSAKLASGAITSSNLPTGGNWSLTSNLNIDSNTLYVDQANNRVGLGTANPAGKLSLTNGSISSDGDAQFFVVTLRRQTTDATQSELFLNGSNERLTLPANTCWTGIVMVTGKQVGGTKRQTYSSSFGIMRDGSGNTTFSTNSAILNSGDYSAAQIDADDANNALRIQVTGAASETVNWMATVQITSVTTSN